ncbi:hypothetical protein P692DRAFT_20813767 [Suillus brevipes Sb2]|nr:hypothetical protein P692DRAFT_20813767 [Suillus brevipes Sb2]
MNQDNGPIKCECHGHCVQMLPHPCFTIEQFLQAIYLVQSGQGWERNPENADCLVHAFHCRCCIYAKPTQEAGPQATSEDMSDTEAPEASDPSKSDDTQYHAESPQVHTYYESSDDEFSPCEFGLVEISERTREDAPDCDIEEAPGHDAEEAVNA